MFSENASNTQGYWKPSKESRCFILLPNTQNENHFNHPQFFKLLSGFHTKWILVRGKS